MAAFNTARGDEQSIEEAVDLWNEACATTKDEALSDDEETPSSEGQGGGRTAKEDGSLGPGKGRSVRLARASVLCTSAQGELILERGTATASARLAEALKIREELLPVGHPATVRGETYRVKNGAVQITRFFFFLWGVSRGARTSITDVRIATGDVQVQ